MRKRTLHVQESTCIPPKGQQHIVRGVTSRLTRTTKGEAAIMHTQTCMSAQKLLIFIPFTLIMEQKCFSVLLSLSMLEISVEQLNIQKKKVSIV